MTMKAVVRLPCVVFFALMAVLTFGPAPAVVMGRVDFVTLPKGDIVPPSGPSCYPYCPPPVPHHKR